MVAKSQTFYFQVQLYIALKGKIDLLDKIRVDVKDITVEQRHKILNEYLDDIDRLCQGFTVKEMKMAQEEYARSLKPS